MSSAPSDPRSVFAAAARRASASVAFCGALGLALGTIASARIAGAPTPSPTPGPDPVTLEQTVIAQIDAHRLDRSLLRADLNEALTPAALASLEARIARYGAPQAIQITGRVDDGAVTSYTLVVYWPTAEADGELGIDDATGKIARLYFVAGRPRTQST